MYAVDTKVIVKNVMLSQLLLVNDYVTKWGIKQKFRGSVINQIS